MGRSAAGIGPRSTLSDFSDRPRVRAPAEGSGGSGSLIHLDHLLVSCPVTDERPPAEAEGRFRCRSAELTEPPLRSLVLRGDLFLHPLDL